MTERKTQLNFPSKAGCLCLQETALTWLKALFFSLQQVQEAAKSSNCFSFCVVIINSQMKSWGFYERFTIIRVWTGISTAAVFITTVHSGKGPGVFSCQGSASVWEWGRISAVQWKGGQWVGEGERPTTLCWCMCLDQLCIESLRPKWGRDRAERQTVRWNRPTAHTADSISHCLGDAVFLERMWPVAACLLTVHPEPDTNCAFMGIGNKSVQGKIIHQ